MEIERALERALDAEDPGPAFAGRVLAAIAREQEGRGAGGSAPTGGGVSVGPRDHRSRVWYAVLPLAATVALTVAGARWQAVRFEEARAETARLEDARARAAHDQLVQALRLTGETLNKVHRAIERSQE